MEIKKDRINHFIIESLQEMLGKDNKKKIDEYIKPIPDLGCDSEDGVNFACILSGKIDYYIPDDVNPFVDDDRRQGRSVREITDLVLRLMTGQEKKHG